MSEQELDHQQNGYHILMALALVLNSSDFSEEELEEIFRRYFFHLHLSGQKQLSGEEQYVLFGSILQDALIFKETGVKPSTEWLVNGGEDFVDVS